MKARKTSRITAFGAAAVAAVALTGFAGTAVAGAPATPSNVTIGENNFVFQGKVKSSKLACEVNRIVRVYRKDGEGNRFTLGADQTDSGGKYRIEVNVINGADVHFAVADLKETDAVKCKRARSADFIP